MRFRHMSLAHRLPEFFRVPLCGRREWSGVTPRADDPDWLAWQKACMRFYTETQRSGIGKVVNEKGYRILGRLDLSGLSCLEIGPGSFPHAPFWRGVPAQFDIADVRKELLDISAASLAAMGVRSRGWHLRDDAVSVPADAASYDAIIAFYSLEHLRGLDAWLGEYDRLLKPGGMLIGAVPAEGGLAWGLGRMLTSRRYARKNFSYDFDKITAIEHCNTAETVLHTLDEKFAVRKRCYWPLRVPCIDCNLVISFIYAKL